MQLIKDHVQIAIDGPVAAGKSSVAKGVADKLDIVYVDTGAMYRTVALGAQEQGIDWENQHDIEDFVEGVIFELRTPGNDEKDGRGVTVIYEGRDVTWEIRSSDISEGASVVSQYSNVRSKLVALQQEISSEKSVVMEGRDIGLRVLPEADLKIFMQADLDVRVRWRAAYLSSIGLSSDLIAVREEIVRRDTREMNREVDPLRPVEDAWILDTTKFSIDEVVDMILSRLEQMSFMGS